MFEKITKNVISGKLQKFATPESTLTALTIKMGITKFKEKNWIYVFLESF